MGKRLRSFERAAGKERSFDFDGMELCARVEVQEETVS